METTWETYQLPTDGLCATSSYASLHSLLYSGDFSDMTIQCRGRKFKTHRAIVCSQSSFFKKALSSDFKEGVSGIVDLPDDDPEVVQSFLEFLYTGTYVNSNKDRVLDASEVTNKHILTRLECPPDYTTYAVTKSPIGLVLNPACRKVTPEQQTTTRQFRWSPYAFKTSAVPTTGDKETPRSWKMEHSARIYLLADKYDVPALRLLARDRFIEDGKKLLMCTKSWRTASWDDTAFFSIIVEIVHGNTSSMKDPLQQALQMLIGMKTEDDVMNKRMRKEMMLNGELAVGVTDYLREAKKFDGPCLRCGYQVPRLGS